eukprot:m.430023 g.430023  ORF g.430023 m.430023 type:complete len:312 (+) comp21391_c1_seq3:34-969(+)
MVLESWGRYHKTSAFLIIAIVVLHVAIQFINVVQLIALFSWKNSLTSDSCGAEIAQLCPDQVEAVADTEYRNSDGDTTPIKFEYYMYLSIFFVVLFFIILRRMVKFLWRRKVYDSGEHETEITYPRTMLAFYIYVQLLMSGMLAPLQVLDVRDCECATSKSSLGSATDFLTLMYMASFYLGLLVIVLLFIGCLCCIDEESGCATETESEDDEDTGETTTKLCRMCKREYWKCCSTWDECKDNSFTICISLPITLPIFILVLISFAVIFVGLAIMGTLLASGTAGVSAFTAFSWSAMVFNFALFLMPQTSEN